jgi:SAM-dependent methyltransferase
MASGGRPHEAMSDVAGCTCPSCGNPSPLLLGQLPRVDSFGGRPVRGLPAHSCLYRCVQCHLVFRFPVLSPSEYERLYDDTAPAIWPDRPDRMDWSLIRGHIGRTETTGARVLDFGCHTGGLLRSLGNNFAGAGIEVNEAAALIARRKTGYPIYPAIEAIPNSGQFDFVTAVDVIEHFADPGSILARLLAVVRPGGDLIITTGDADNWLWRLVGARWWYCYYAEHLAFISERWLRVWLARAGADAKLVATHRFRYQRLSLLRYVRQAVLTAMYSVAPRAYVRTISALKGALRRSGEVDPPGSGLARDHILLVVRKSP